MSRKNTRTERPMQLIAGPTSAEILRATNRVRGSAFVALQAAEERLALFDEPEGIVSAKRILRDVRSALSRARTHYYVLERLVVRRGSIGEGVIASPEFELRYAAALYRMERLSDPERGRR